MSYNMDIFEEREWISMQKLIRILAILALVLVLASLCLMVVCIPFRHFLGSIFYPGAEILDGMPLIYWPAFVNGLALLVCMVPLVICCGNQRGGIWLELVVLAILALVLPLLSEVINIWAAWLFNSHSSIYAAASSVSARIAGYCMAPARLGTVLAYVAAGMSMAFKHMRKKMQ